MESRSNIPIMRASSIHMLNTSHLNRTLQFFLSVVLDSVCSLLPSILSSRIVSLGTSGSVIILQGFVYEARMEQTSANSSANIKWETGRFWQRNWVPSSNWLHSAEPNHIPIGCLGHLVLSAEQPSQRRVSQVHRGQKRLRSSHRSWYPKGDSPV